ncbi:hypothetical protein L218DRAFT_955479 [Marasmius fiardii PR-910]|nr:hypothetical protein L218DRAFT_955479 [Marasmius fiardii PR-910]
MLLFRIVVSHPTSGSSTTRPCVSSPSPKRKPLILNHIPQDSSSGCDHDHLHLKILHKISAGSSLTGLLQRSSLLQPCVPPTIDGSFVTGTNVEANRNAFLIQLTCNRTRYSFATFRAQGQAHAPLEVNVHREKDRTRQLKSRLMWRIVA